MKKRGATSSSIRSSSGPTLGRERFAKISAVEGIELTREAEKRAADVDRRRLSPERRIQEIVAAYRKG